MDLSTYLSQYLDFPPRFALLVLAFVAGIYTLYSFFATLRYGLMKRAGFTPEELKAVFSTRQSGFNLEALIARHGERTLMRLDAIPRKLAHLTSGIWQITFMSTMVDTPVHSLQVILVASCLRVIIGYLALRDERLIGLGGLCYGAMSRVRDGALGRINAYAGALGFLHYLPVTILLYFIQRYVSDGQMLKMISNLIYLPLIVGDTLGELVGSLWGKQKLRVIGIGEINRKSLLGTAAVFAGSLVPLVAVVLSRGVADSWLVLGIGLALLTTLTELAAPRGTDNFFIPLLNTLAILLFLALGVG